MKRIALIGIAVLSSVLVQAPALAAEKWGPFAGYFSMWTSPKQCVWTRSDGTTSKTELTTTGGCDYSTYEPELGMTVCWLPTRIARVKNLNGKGGWAQEVGAIWTNTDLAKNPYIPFAITFKKLAPGESTSYLKVSNPDYKNHQVGCMTRPIMPTIGN